MEIIDKSVNYLLNKFKTRLELIQAIANLTRQNINGQYDDRIEAYREILIGYKNVRLKQSASGYIATREETAAIMQFNKDVRFKITE